MAMEFWGLSALMQLLLGFVGFVAIGALGAWLESRYPARPARGSWRNIYFGKNALILIGVLATMGIVQKIQLRIVPAWKHSGEPLKLGQWVLSFALVFIALDFLMYWVHRAYHSARLWTFHRWHHSLREINWMSGVRMSLIELAIDATPSYLLYLVWPGTLPFDVAYFFYTALFTHTNLTVPWPRVGRWLVLPQYHRVHHGLDERFHNRNFANVWVVWDRFFGTYQDPAETGDEYAMGLDQEPKTWKMVAGL